MTTDVIPVLHVADAAIAAGWYARIGFEVEFEHRFEPHLPAYVGLRREGARIHLSEHAGDARPDTLVYVWVDAVEAIAAEFGVAMEQAPWGNEVSLTDPDANRLRIAEPLSDPDVDDRLGSGTSARLTALEHAMWADETRGDRRWMDAHLTDDFVEFGYSGRTWTRADILEQEIGAIEASLSGITVRAVGRDGALVTYISEQSRGAANRASLWHRVNGHWLLAFHQGTPIG